MLGKKKKNKVSKVTGMGDGERIRYLQHRAELELEVIRRKQQLIAAFTKTKLKREGAFTRLNMAKINEQWRFILRQIKYKELYGSIKHLKNHFDRSIKIKDMVIYKLYRELELADTNHRRLQEANVTMTDKLIGMHKQGIKFSHDNHRSALCHVKYDEIMKLNQLKKKLEDGSKHLELIVFGQNEFFENKLVQIRTRNTVNMHIMHLKEKEILELIQVSNNIKNLWMKINTMISKYESMIKNKRRQYDYMKDQDDTAKVKIALFSKQEAQLQVFEIFENELDVLSREREVSITKFTDQVKWLVNRIWKLHQEIKLTETIDAIHLKRLSVISNGVIQDLGRIMKKGTILQLLIKVCSDLKPPSVPIKKHTIHEKEFSRESCKKKSVKYLYNKMENFWQRYNYVKADNILMWKEHNQLTLENKRLRHALRTYLIAAVRIPPFRLYHDLNVIVN